MAIELDATMKGTAAMGWNHNVRYHSVVLSAIPSPCHNALDVGCGRGDLARKLAPRCDKVTALDLDHKCIAFAKAVPDAPPNTVFVQGDVLEHPFPENSFDFIVTVATLHHLPLCQALERCRKLLRPGGVLVVIGLYRNVTLIDYAFAATAFPISRAIRSIVGEATVGAPIAEPKETLREIRRECRSLLPGGTFRRRLFFRYSFVWRKH